MSPNMQVYFMSAGLQKVDCVVIEIQIIYHEFTVFTSSPASIDF